MLMSIPCVAVATVAAVGLPVSWSMLGLLVLMTSTALHPAINAKHSGNTEPPRQRRISMKVVIALEPQIQIDPEGAARGIGGQFAVTLQVVVPGTEVRVLRVAAAVRGPPVEIPSTHTDLRVGHGTESAHARQPRRRNARA